MLLDHKISQEKNNDYKEWPQHKKSILTVVLATVIASASIIGLTDKNGDLNLDVIENFKSYSLPGNE